jgi:twitching motility protein PilT
MAHNGPSEPIPITNAEDIASILLQAIDLEVSDIHLTVGNPPMFRLHGSVTPTTGEVLDASRLHKMLYDILDDQQRKTLERDKELDFAMSLGKVARLRVNCFYTRRGEAAVFRVIPTKIKSLEELGCPPVLKKIAEKPRGLVLVTGPTGSGKSTTLAAMVDYINNTRDDHILTIEDPVEFVHEHKRCIVNQREVGPNTKSFAAALRSALREDPDIILVGEMRDLETISLALTASETGHLVFGTLHTQSAPKTCDRIIDVFPPTQQGLVRTMFAESFQAVISQTLIKKVKGGRCCAMEIMLGTAATRSLIREAKTYQLPTIIQTAQKLGMQSLDQVIKDLLMRGIISQADALMKCNNPDFIVRDGEKMLEAMQAGVPMPTGPADTAPARNPGLMGGMAPGPGANNPNMTPFPGGMRRPSTNPGT